MTESQIFQKINESKLLLAYFSYPECNVCKTLRPKVEELVAGYDGLEFIYIDTHLFPMVSGQNMVFAVPTVVLFLDGKDVKRWSRHLSLQEIEDGLDRYYELVYEELGYNE
ncbi:MAG: thioredoxin family protein [Calditrichaeota bacterium]|nr:thioredoxin family protein [Calditrichota bacterium]